MNQSQASLLENKVLDNPIWSALSTEQKALAKGNDLAKRFPSEIAPLGALKNQSSAAYEALEDIASSDGVAVFLDTKPVPPRHWTMLHSDRIAQMVCEAPIYDGASVAFRELSHADVPEMLALTKLTEPGPFRPRTIDLGTYLGIHASGSLVAMAGERLHLAGFTEVSAVCTHPDFRGRGYSKALISALMSRITSRGETPILHVRAANAAAISLYERLGFKERRQLHLAVLQHAPAAAVVSSNGHAE